MKKILLILLTLCHAYIIQAQPRIVSSIYPLQQIANAISGQTTELIADTYLSPHQYAIKPADAKNLNEADLVIWIGEAMMPQLTRHIDKRNGNKLTITASQLDYIRLINNQREHQHGDGHNSEHLLYDPHLWLSIDNAGVIASAIADALITLDKDNADTYRNNLAHFQQELQSTYRELIALFESRPPVPYFVFHDAYAYFEKTFGVSPVDMIRIHAGQSPKTKHLVELKQRLASLKKGCIFREPQFKSTLIDRLVEGTNITVSTLDPVGYSTDPKGYAAILRNMANQMIQCGAE
ncbi:MAG: hypothetical protein CSA45_03870 [Gammaproteobacteria bacterium]|nr:MAG: hypothetical protein CSA45_03870 [Gammaproteobacteria bacterium]